MSTLLLRFAGPMQAWGADTRFDVCRTNREPTKSGVIGFVAAALGLRRDAALDELTALRFGVRVDREGVLLRDLHTVRKDEKTSYLTTRYYLCDAVFLVGLSGENEELMQRLEYAVRNPSHPLFLGRRSCPPEGKVCLGLRQMGLEDALKCEPRLCYDKSRKKDEKVRVRIVLDDPHGSARLNDVPVSFSPFDRRYAYRAAREIWHEFPESGHDPMLELHAQTVEVE